MKFYVEVTADAYSETGDFVRRVKVDERVNEPTSDRALAHSFRKLADEMIEDDDGMLTSAGIELPVRVKVVCALAILAVLAALVAVVFFYRGPWS